MYIISLKISILSLNSLPEYISPERIEQLIGQCPMISQVFVHGESTKNKLVAIVVLDVDGVRKWLEAIGAFDSEITINDLQMLGGWLGRNKRLLEMLSSEILLQIKTLCKELHGYEIVRKVFFELEAPWSSENGLLTPTMKIKRPVLRAKYGAAISAMYEELQQGDGGDIIAHPKSKL